MELYSIKSLNNQGVRFSIFRWHPLWSFVIEACKDFLSADDIKWGRFNAGYEITEHKANLIAERLEKIIESKGAGLKVNNEENEWGDKWAEEHVNFTIKKVAEAFNEPDVLKNYRYKPLKEWLEQDDPEFWENLTGFKNFCRDSGGFRIF